METWKLGNYGSSESRNHWRLGGLDCETRNLGNLEAFKVESRPTLA